MVLGCSGVDFRGSRWFQVILKCFCGGSKLFYRVLIDSRLLFSGFYVILSCFRVDLWGYKWF